MVKMVKMVNNELSEFILLNIDLNAKFRFKRNPNSDNFGIVYYSDNYPQYKSLGTVDESQVQNEDYRNQIQKIIENLFETSGDEIDFIKRCKSIYGRRLRTETINEKLTLDELEKVEEFINILRKGD